MADLLGQPVPNLEFPWVRGSVFGFQGRALGLWATCGNQAKNPGELKGVDRHEVAHTFITGLSGPDQYPPRLLIEGWAETQSPDRNGEIRSLAKDRKRGRAPSLQEFVRPDGYRRGGGWEYSQGGPVAHYLIERYGDEAFLRLYSGVRRDSFHDDWQALVEGYSEANRAPLPLPSNTAFVLEGERTDGETENLRSIRPPRFEFRAIFEDQEFWIFDNNHGYSGVDWFLMATPEHCGELTRSDSGWSHGWVGPDWNPYAAREGASELLAFYRREANLSDLLPFRDIPQVDVTYQIERVVRPTEGKAGRWNVWLTRCRADGDTKEHYQVELDPAKRWWTTRFVEEGPGARRFETDAEYDHIGDAFMPVTLQFRIELDEDTATARWRVRPMSEVERQELKRRVEQAVRSGRRVPYRGLRRFLLAIVIGCPLVGATLLAVARRCEPA